MMASHRVVMGDSPAVRNHRVERRALDGAPLCAELARPAKRVGFLFRSPRRARDLAGRPLSLELPHSCRARLNRGLRLRK